MPSVTVYKRGSKWYGKWLEDGRYIKRSLDTTDKATAKRIALSMEDSMLKRKFGIREKVTLTCDDVLAEFSKLASLTLRPQTAYLYYHFFSMLVKHSGAATLDQITKRDIESWKAELSTTHSPSSVNNAVRQARAVVRWAMKTLDWQGPDPFEDVERVREPQKQPKFLTTEQVNALLWGAAMVSADCYLAVLLGAYCGLRKSEIDNARWDWIDWKRGLLTVTPTEHYQTKTKSSANRVALHGRLLEDLPALWLHLGKPSGYMIAPEILQAKAGKGAVPYRYNYQWWFEIACRNAGIDTISPHVLRHTIASHMAMKGYSMRQIQEVLRHSSIRSTEIYAHMETETFRIEGVL